MSEHYEKIDEQCINNAVTLLDMFAQTIIEADKEQEV